MDVRFANNSNLLKNYEFTNGEFNLDERVTNLSWQCDEKIPATEEDTYLLDTLPEFLTATWFSPKLIKIIEIKDAKAKEVFEINVAKAKEIEKELPQNQEGGLRLCAMWMKKSIETRFIDFKEEVLMSKTQTLANYELIIKSIKDRAKRLKVTPSENIDIDKELPTYFKVAIEKEVNSAVNEAFKKVSNFPEYTSNVQKYTKILSIIKGYIVNFYLNPTPETYKKVGAIPCCYQEYSSSFDDKGNTKKADFYESMEYCFDAAIAALNEQLINQMIDDSESLHRQILTIFTPDELTTLGIVPEGK